MRKVVAGFAASLDGYIEGPNGEYDWILIDPEINFAEQMKRFDAYLLGRITYEKMKGGVTKGSQWYVVSNTLPHVDQGFQLIGGNIQQSIQQLKEEEGKDIAVFGGASLLASLLDMKLVDEISVAVIPVLLGKGKPMVSMLQNKVALQLMDTKRYGNGTIQLTYEVK
jgi:dihydrofolate reductase